jgi:hypothetical protein
MNERVYEDPPNPLAAATADTAASTRLTGWRLHAARAGWLFVVVFFLTPYAAAMPGYLTAIAHPATRNAQLSRRALAALAQVGISLDTYAWVCVIALALGMLAAVASGAVLFWRRGDDWMALVVALFVAIHPVGIASVALGTNAVPQDTVGWIPLGVVTVIQTTVQFSVMLLFPSGRFVPRWSWLLVILMSGATMWAAGQADIFQAARLIGLAYPPLVGATIACMVYRYRHVSTPVQRLQTKWIIVGLVVTPLANVVCFVPATFTPLGQTIYAPIAFLVYLLVLLVTPLAFFIAVQRYRLYEIDTIINRALVYGSLTAILGGLYAGTVIGAQALIGAITRDVVPEQPIVLVGTTLVIAALLQPLRRWLQSTVDRRFYRRKYDASRTLATFGATLRQETDVVALREQLLAVVGETMQPAHASLWLLPAPGAPAVSKPLAQGEMKSWPVASTAAGTMPE